MKQTAVSKKTQKQATWMLVGAGAAMLAGTLVERGLNTGFRAIKKKDPPHWAGGNSWQTTLGWAALSAATVAAAQLAARRGAHFGLAQLTGKRSPFA